MIGRVFGIGGTVFLGVGDGFVWGVSSLLGIVVFLSFLVAIRRLCWRRLVLVGVLSLGGCWGLETGASEVLGPG